MSKTSSCSLIVIPSVLIVFSACSSSEPTTPGSEASTSQGGTSDVSGGAQNKTSGQAKSSSAGGAVSGSTSSARVTTGGTGASRSGGADTGGTVSASTTAETVSRGGMTSGGSTKNRSTAGGTNAQASGGQSAASVGGSKSTGGTTGATGGAGAASTNDTNAVIGEMPLVYDEEDTGTDCAKPPLPAFSELPSISYLPDPFERADGTRIGTKADWRCRRAEIKAILEKYDVGVKPGKPSTFKANFSNGKISITVGEGSNSFTMTATISRPSGAPNTPIPAIIGINTPTGSLPAELFSKRGIATITYDSSQLASSSFTGGGTRSDGNFMKLYPNATAGYMIRWAWGVSRIIDALEELPEANIDLTRMAVSGCSFQGKIALYAGAFDERIALTLPHESGGGGTISWRYSDMLEDRDKTEVENLHHALGAPWYAEAVAQFANSPDKLPFDQHELIGMIAPRAVLAIESSRIARMGAEAARVDALAAREIWKALGVPTRMGRPRKTLAIVNGIRASRPI